MMFQPVVEQVPQPYCDCTHYRPNRHACMPTCRSASAGMRTSYGRPSPQSTYRRGLAELRRVTGSLGSCAPSAGVLSLHPLPHYHRGSADETSFLGIPSMMWPDSHVPLNHLIPEIGKQKGSNVTNAAKYVITT